MKNLPSTSDCKREMKKKNETCTGRVSLEDYLGGVTFNFLTVLFDVKIQLFE